MRRRSELALVLKDEDRHEVALVLIDGDMHAARALGVGARLLLHLTSKRRTETSGLCLDMILFEPGYTPLFS